MRLIEEFLFDRDEINRHTPLESWLNGLSPIDRKRLHGFLIDWKTGVVAIGDLEDLLGPLTRQVLGRESVESIADIDVLTSILCDALYQQVVKNGSVRLQSLGRKEVSAETERAQ